MIDDFLKHNVDLGAPFMINTRNITQIFCTDIASGDLRNRDGFFNAGILSLGIVFTFALAVTSKMT
jgi:hypothetical protein